jgi:tRNA A37 threonylcarbamoyladenosine modification protein TsaB
MLGVTSFDLIAYNVFSDQDFLVAIDAAHGHYYVCGYSKDKNIILQPCYLSKEETEEKALPVYGFEQLDLKGYKAVVISDCLYNAVLAKEAELGDDVEALYVRKSQAEEGRK